jgi:broad specificity phosphatase PhoE
VGQSQWRDRAGLSPAASHRHDGAVTVGCHDVECQRGANREPGAKVTVRLQLIVPALTPGARHGLIGSADGLDRHGQQAAIRRARSWPSAMAISAPDRHCVETATLIGLHTVVDPRLVDWDLGSWTGKSLTEIAQTTGEEVERWSTDPEYATHGGESLNQLVFRVTDWLGRLEEGEHDRVIAMAPTPVVRAILVSVLNAPTATFWRLDLEPLTSVHITLRPGRRAVRWSSPGETRLTANP